MRLLIVATMVLMSATTASGAALSVTVKNSSGQPVQDAVVTLASPTASHEPIRFDWPMKMAQQNIRFDPFVLIVPVGAEVSFPNYDKVRHHVYSFSPAKTFELKLYGHDETRTVRFDKPGTVALGCNIHDRMVAFIRVVDTPFAAKTNAAGVAELQGVPEGRAVLHVWQPYLKGAGNEVTEAITVPPGGDMHEIVTVDVRPPPPMPMP